MTASARRARASARAGAMLAAAAGLVLSQGVAAQASSIYPPTGSCSVSAPTASAGASLTVECRAGTFGAEETLTVTVTGERGDAATIATLRSAITTASALKVSEADGSVAPISIRLPSDAVGAYNIAIVSPTSAGSTATVSVARVDGALPVSGLDQSVITSVVVGGGVLAVAGAILTVAAVRRGRR